ncbi:unnamed protein product, partial [Rotaria sp. Silwood1]
KFSSRHHVFSNEYLSKINLPKWEYISPNINHILSDKHTKSGVYAHEIHLIQQELEALLSMSMIRKNILQSTNINNLNLNIYQYQQVENIYSLKTISKKSLINHHQQQYNKSYILLDRQISMTPIIDSYIDKIWSNINTYYHHISSNDILIIKNFFEYNEKFKEKILNYKKQYNNNKLTQLNIIKKLNKEYYQDLLNIIKIKPLITHYTNQTILERFQTKLYQYYRKSFNYDLNNNSSLRCSTRLQKNSQLKSDHDHQQSSIFKHNRKTKFTSSLSIKTQERIQFVHDYLADQHPLTNEYIQQQFINNIKLTNKKQKISIKNSYKNIFEKKLSILISLLNECSSLTLYALKRAYLQFNNEQTWQKLNTIEHDINLLIQNIDMTNDYNNSKNIKNIFQNLDHLLNEWTIYEEDFHHQFEQLFNINI